MNQSDKLYRIDRRVALKWIASASVAIPGLDGITLGGENATGYGRDPDLIRAYAPGDLWPLTFSTSQRRVVMVLCDMVIPADEKSPSASSQGVHDFIDEWISSPYPAQSRDRSLILKGLAWLDEEAVRRGVADFVLLEVDEQIAICRKLARDAKSRAKVFPGSFFLRIRNLIAGGYYTTPVGMKDVGYVGNVAMAEWRGPPPEVLTLLELSAE